MAETNVQNIDAITLGNGVLYLGEGENEVNLGQLTGDVELVPTVEFYDFKAGVPKRLIKRFVLEEGAAIKASLAELSPENYEVMSATATKEEIAAAPSATPPVPASTRFHHGGKTALTDQPLRFVHTKPNGKKVTVFFHRAIVESGVPIKFSEETVVLQDVTLTALADSTQDPGEDLYYIDFEE